MGELEAVKGIKNCKEKREKDFDFRHRCGPQRALNKVVHSVQIIAFSEETFQFCPQLSVSFTSQ